MHGDRKCAPAVRRTVWRPHMRFDLSLQTMMSSRIHPGAHSSRRGGVSRIDPSIHDVRLPPPAGPERKFVISDRYGRFMEVVEPDGFEPTTSCLQSTRSTN